MQHHCNNLQQKCNVEKEKEIDKELEKEQEQEKELEQKENMLDMKYLKNIAKLQRKELQ